MSLVIHVWNDTNGDVKLLTSTASKPTVEHGTFKRGNIGMQLFVVAYAHLCNVLTADELDIDVDENSARDMHRAAKMFVDSWSAKELTLALEGVLA